MWRGGADAAQPVLFMQRGTGIDCRGKDVGRDMLSGMSLRLEVSLAQYPKIDKNYQSVGRASY